MSARTLFVLLASLAGCTGAEVGPAEGVSEASLSAAPAASTPAPAILSAYLGAVNQQAIPFCATGGTDAGNLEGMPVVFSQQIYNPSMTTSDFVVTNSEGVSVNPLCVTTAPANEEDEDNTILLVGDFVPSTSVTIASVDVIGPLEAEGATYNVPGASLEGLEENAVLPVTDSIFLVYADVPTPANSEIGAPNGCPSTTAQVVRATFTGGIRVIPGVDATTHISILDANGNAIPFSGVSAAEQDDDDNILDVCLTSTTKPVEISLTAGAYTAPNGLANTSTHVALEQ